MKLGKNSSDNYVESAAPFTRECESFSRSCTTFCVEFSIGEVSLQLNVLLNSVVGHIGIECGHYQSNYVVFPSISAFLDKATRFPGD